MSEFKASGFSDEFGSSGPDIVGLTTFTSPYYFVPPLVTLKSPNFTGAPRVSTVI